LFFQQCRKPVSHHHRHGFAVPKTVKTQFVALEAGYNQIPLLIGGLPRGIYLVMLRNRQEAAKLLVK
jgi:hypothetical protein